MSKEKLMVIKEADLTNNCPECFNQDLKLSFYQKHYASKFAYRVSDQISHQLICNKCNSTIYPVNWTEDIERTFDYYQKMAQPQPASRSFTSLFWILLFGGIAIVAAGIYFLFQQNLI